jgi:hypothetical protein
VESFDVNVDQIIESADHAIARLTNTAVFKGTSKTAVSVSRSTSGGARR